MGTYGATRLLGQEELLLNLRVAIPQGATVKESRSFVFDEPGYYLISATSQNEVIDEPRDEGDRRMPLANENAAQVWVLITSSGGHLDRVYDESWAKRRDRYLEFGALGAFRSYSRSLNSISGDVESL